MSQASQAKALRRCITVPDYIYTHRVCEELVAEFETLFFERVGAYDLAFLEDETRFRMAQRIGYGCMNHLAARLENAKASGHYPAHPEIVEAGDSGFDWRYCPTLLSEGSAVLCFGVGSNISFETALAKRVGCSVWCFDPTPGGIRHAEVIAEQRPEILFRPWGVGGRDEVVTFYSPGKGKKGSLSEANLRGGDPVADGQLYRLETILSKLGMERIDLLKIDIEGSEYDVIESIRSGDIEIDQFCVEFDQPVPPWKTERMIDALQLVGFWLMEVWGLNALFIHERKLR